ncbi:hypothetical protein NEDG_01114 [Nematocida displodere]|uniref:Protein transport protein SFT2 n=1 Tax=Nematocida displodere TaxID=1805483 RepID=A0A177EAM8_9MICR|nr:hypothetical protein NEDG_01114 [Nematocida displodere]
MNLDKTIQGALDTLKLGKESRKGRELPFTYTDFFAEKNTRFETLNLTWRTRMWCAASCLVLSFFFLFNSLMKLIALPVAPQTFVFSFTLFSLFLVAMLGFFGGFKTFLTNACSREMLPYSVCFMGNSALSLMCKHWGYLVQLSITLLQLMFFTAFFYKYITRKLSLGASRTLSALSLFK